jgi:diaminohydroxyphosphoribosylaminopyrimidine deaminase/5-amino-6-(5-phosphoribosylamino)uracil reductase
MTYSAADHASMAHALRLAERGLATTTPNPRVGCIVVSDGRIVGEGWHHRAGDAHAEVLALRAAGHAARGATVYVTLEPCAHHGRTPPCVEALINSGVSRVVAAMQDPNPLVAGAGLARLASAGVDASAGLMADEACELNIGFVSRMTRGRPWLRLKAAATLDGKTALNNGTSKWITGEAARRDGHRWRARACAVLTGIGTVREDDPELTVRAVPCERQPLRVLVDARLEGPLSARILATGHCLVATAVENREKTAALIGLGVETILLPDPQGKVDLPGLMQELGRRGCNEVHVEAGFKLNGSLLREGVVDELLLYVAPMLTGDAARGLFNLPELQQLDHAIRLRLCDIRKIGSDLRILARPRPV